MTKNRIKNDLILVAVIFIISLSVFLVFKFCLKAGNTVLVTVNGDSVYSLPLNKNTVKTLKTEYGKNVIEIKDGFVSVQTADCRDKICVNHRSISKTGETIVCLPHKMVVEISEKE